MGIKSFYRLCDGFLKLRLVDKSGGDIGHEPIIAPLAYRLLSFFVGADPTVDFGGVDTCESPGVGKIFSPQRGIRI